MKSEKESGDSKKDKIKVVLLGNEGVGKTSLIGQIKDHRYNSNTNATVGAMFVNKELALDGQKYEIQIWDTAGQERYRTVAPIYFRDAHGILLVYDVTNRKSFEDMNYWFNEVVTKGEKNAAVVIVGNKCDLPESTVEMKEALLLAEERNSRHLSVSAKTGEAVEEAFKLLLRQVLRSGVHLECSKRYGDSVSMRKSAIKPRTKKEDCKC